MVESFTIACVRHASCLFRHSTPSLAPSAQLLQVKMNASGVLLFLAVISIGKKRIWPGQGCALDRVSDVEAKMV